MCFYRKLHGVDLQVSGRAVKIFEEGVCADLKQGKIVWYNSIGAMMANKVSNLYMSHCALNSCAFLWLDMVLWLFFFCFIMPFSVFYQLFSVPLSSEDTIENSRKPQTRKNPTPFTCCSCLNLHVAKLSQMFSGAFDSMKSMDNLKKPR